MFDHEFQRRDFRSTADGAADWYLVRTGHPDKPRIVVLHGHGSGGDQILLRPDVAEIMTRFLVENDFSVLSPNLRGNAWMNAAAVSDLAGIIRAEQRQQPRRKLLIVAGSMGGTGALIFAQCHRELVDGVGALGAATDLETYLAWLAGRTEPVLRDIRAALETAYPTRESRQRHSTLRHAGNLTLPVYLVHGDADPIIPVEEARQLSRVLKQAPTFHLQEIPGGGHDSPLPYFRQVVTHLMEDLQ